MTETMAAILERSEERLRRAESAERALSALRRVWEDAKKLHAEEIKDWAKQWQNAWHDRNREFERAEELQEKCDELRAQLSSASSFPLTEALIENARLKLQLEEARGVLKQMSAYVTAGNFTIDSARAEKS